MLDLQLKRLGYKYNLSALISIRKLKTEETSKEKHFITR